MCTESSVSHRAASHGVATEHLFQKVVHCLLGVCTAGTQSAFSVSRSLRNIYHICPCLPNSRAASGRHAVLTQQAVQAVQHRFSQHHTCSHMTRQDKFCLVGLGGLKLSADKHCLAPVSPWQPCASGLARLLLHVHAIVGNSGTVEQCFDMHTRPCWQRTSAQFVCPTRIKPCLRRRQAVARAAGTSQGTTAYSDLYEWLIASKGLPRQAVTVEQVGGPKAPDIVGCVASEDMGAGEVCFRMVPPCNLNSLAG